MSTPVFAESIRRAELPAALDALQAAARSRPSEAWPSTALFQLLAVLGQRERALRQLRVAGQLDKAALPMVHTDALALHCEKLRAEVFAGHRSGVRGVDQRTLQLAAGEA